VHVIGLQMPFFDPTLLLPRQLPKHLAQVLPQLPLQPFASALRNKYHVLFAFPLRMT
jgi:hypothetical protein